MKRTCISHYVMASCITALSVTSLPAMGNPHALFENNIRSSVQNRITLKDVINYVESNSPYVFVYDERIKNELNNMVSIRLKGEKIKTILANLARQSGLTLDYNGKQISIRKGSSRSNATPQTILQNKKSITGIVTDKNGDPLIGATVRVVGSDIATVTDTDGKYSIDAHPGATLRYSYIGYADKDVKTGARSNYNIIMSEDDNALQELVVIGYVVRRRAHATELTPDMMTIDVLLDERIRELVGEEPRRFTLVRTNKLIERTKKYNTESGPNIKDYHTLWPIPQDVIDANTDAKLPQNPGYDN